MARPSFSEQSEYLAILRELRRKDAGEDWVSMMLDIFDGSFLSSKNLYFLFLLDRYTRVQGASLLYAFNDNLDVPTVCSLDILHVIQLGSGKRIMQNLIGGIITSPGRRLTFRSPAGSFNALVASVKYNPFFYFYPSLGFSLAFLIFTHQLTQIINKMD